jgi:hypothetical protein
LARSAGARTTTLGRPVHGGRTATFLTQRERERERET